MQQKVTLRELENLVAVANRASVTLGAKAMGISQPAMSKSMQTLERSLGVTLLVRHRGHGVSLTPEGTLLLAEARSLLSRVGDLTTLVADATSHAAGQVILGSLVTVAPIVIPAVVREFGRRCPDVDVRIRTGHQDKLLSWLRTGEIHVAITYDIELGRGVRFSKVLDAEPHAMLPADHRLAGAETLELSEISDEPYILLDLPLSREYFTSLFLAAGVPYAPLARHADLSLVRSLVGNDFGFSLVNLQPATRTAQDGTEVAYVKLRSTVKPLALGLVQRTGGEQPRSVEEFMNHARSTLVLPGCSGNGTP